MAKLVTHPLATRTGINAFMRIIEAQAVWKQATKTQQRLIADLCRPVMPDLLALGVVSDEDLPHVPYNVALTTRRAMYRRGLISEITGRLTARAVHAYYWAARTPPPAVIDAHLPEGDVT